MGQIRKLLRRCHPKTLQLMQEHRNADGSLWVPSGGTYERLEIRRALAEAVAAHVVPDGFYPYVSDDFIGQWRRAAWKPDHSTETRPTVEECSLARLRKVRNKEKLKLTRTAKFRLTGKSPPGALMRTVGGSSSPTRTAKLLLTGKSPPGALMRTVGGSSSRSTTVAMVGGDGGDVRTDHPSNKRSDTVDDEETIGSTNALELDPNRNSSVPCNKMRRC